MVVGFAAGGGNDILARILAKELAQSLGQPVVVENRAGAGGLIATRQRVKSLPDVPTIAKPDVQALFAAQGVEPLTSDPKSFASQVGGELTRWGRDIKAMNMPSTH